MSLLAARHLSRKGIFMKSKLIYSFCSVLLLFLVSMCASGKIVPARGTLEIKFELYEPADKDLEPSYQTVVWLEDQNGEYLQSVFVSEYLAYGGYNDSTICTSWNRVSDWNNVTMEHMDAVTNATPDLAITTVRVSLAELNILAKQLNYVVETHVVEDENILYRGNITLSGKSVSSDAEAITGYTGSGILGKVSAFYSP